MTLRGSRLVVLWWVLLWTTTVQAEERPWDRGVTESARAEAERLQLEGRQLYVEEKYLDAVGKFEAAIELWPDPAFQISAALGLMKLTRWVDAARHLERALAHGKEALEGDYDRARAAFVESVSHTGTIQVSGTQQRAEISVDGNVILVGPGSASVRVAPGRHVVIAKRGSLASEPITLDVGAGQTLAAEPLLYVTTVRWQWDRWKPWGTFSAGVLVALVGVPLLVHTYDIFDEYEKKLSAMCSAGCPELPPQLELIRERSYRWRTATVAAFVGGGVVAGLGLLWVGFNSQVQQRKIASDVAVVPSLSGGSIVWTRAW